MKEGMTFVFIWAIIVIVCVVGWVKCIINFINCDFEKSYKAEIIYGVGVLAPPMGAIVGYIDLGK